MHVKLTVVKGRPEGKTLVFGLGEYYFGRGEECQVRFNSEWVSRQHCVLRISSSSVQIDDLASRNGTLVNGSLIGRDHPLVDGDELQLGPVLFQVSVAEPSSIEFQTPPAATIRDTDSNGDDIPLDSTLLNPLAPPEHPDAPPS
ncbi:MAG: FHA domain-containing protein [Gemmataceae bacterium]